MFDNRPSHSPTPDSFENSVSLLHAYDNQANAHNLSTVNSKVTEKSDSDGKINEERPSTENKLTYVNGEKKTNNNSDVSNTLVDISSTSTKVPFPKKTDRNDTRSSTNSTPSPVIQSKTKNSFPEVSTPDSLEANDTKLRSESVESKKVVESIKSNSLNKDNPDENKPVDNESWNGNLLGPMEPMKIAKANYSWDPREINLHLFDPGDPDISSGEIRNISGFPLINPDFTKSEPSSKSVPSISEDTKLASILNDQRYNPTSSINGASFDRNDISGWRSRESLDLRNFHTGQNVQPPILGTNAVNINHSTPIDQHTQQHPAFNNPINDQYIYTGSPPHVNIPQQVPQATPCHIIQPNNEHVYNAGEYLYYNGLQHNNRDGNPNRMAIPRGMVPPYEVYRQSEPLSYQNVTSGTPILMPMYNDGVQPVQHINTAAYPVFFSAMPMNTMQSSNPVVVQVNQLNSENVDSNPISTVPVPDSDKEVVTGRRKGYRKRTKSTTSSQQSRKRTGDHRSGDRPVSRMVPPVITPDRIYRCSNPGCDWSFTRSSDQKRHVRSHQKPSLRCSYCDIKPNADNKGTFFYRLDVMKRHLRLIHFKLATSNKNGSGFCRICAKPFKNPKEFLAHCDVCAREALAQKLEKEDVAKKN